MSEERSTWAWMDDRDPAPRRTLAYTHHEVELYPRFGHTEVPVPAEPTACVFEPDIWFSTGSSAFEREDRRVAVRACADCWMRVECLDYALEHDVEGIWGGKTKGQRESMTAGRKQRRLRA